MITYVTGSLEKSPIGDGIPVKLFFRDGTDHSTICPESYDWRHDWVIYGRHEREDCGMKDIIGYRVLASDALDKVLAW